MADLVYLDASAIVKLVVEEAESSALRRFLRDRPQRVASALALVEVHLAAARRVPALPPERVREVLARLTLIPVAQPILETAAGFEDRHIRALDAIHLATAASLGDDLAALIAYDHRLLDAGSASGLRTEHPT